MTADIHDVQWGWLKHISVYSILFCIKSMQTVILIIMFIPDNTIMMVVFAPSLRLTLL